MENNTYSKQYILSINIDAKTSTLFELKNKIEEIQPIVCLIQDPPHIKTEDIIRILRAVAPNNYEYILYEKVNNGNNTRINNIILVNINKVIIKNIHSYNEENKADSLGVSLNWKEENNNENIVNNEGFNNNIKSTIKNCFIIFSIYIRPKTPHSDTKKCIQGVSKNW